jgi:hypothetical protein
LGSNVTPIREDGLIHRGCSPGTRLRTAGTLGGDSTGRSRSMTRGARSLTTTLADGPSRHSPVLLLRQLHWRFVRPQAVGAGAGPRRRWDTEPADRPPARESGRHVRFEPRCVCACFTYTARPCSVRRFAWVNGRLEVSARSLKQGRNIHTQPTCRDLPHRRDPPRSFGCAAAAVRTGPAGRARDPETPPHPTSSRPAAARWMGQA